MSTSLTLDSSRRGDGTYVLVAAGEIDMSNIEVFNQGLAAAIRESGGNGILLDLAAVTYLDSTAITALFSEAEHISIVAHPYLMDVFTVSGLTELVTVEPARLGSEP